KRVTITAGGRTTVTFYLTKARGASERAPAPAPAATAAPAAATPLSGEGTLAIASNPWCSVAVDGVDRGQTPVNLKLAAGKHTLVVTNPEFHIKRQITVTIKPNETVRKKLDFSE